MIGMKDIKKSFENVQNYPLATGKSKVVTDGHHVIMLNALVVLISIINKMLARLSVKRYNVGKA